LAYAILTLYRDTPPTQISTLSLHDALPISMGDLPHRRILHEGRSMSVITEAYAVPSRLLGIYRFLLRTKGHGESIDVIEKTLSRSEEHTSELQSRFDLVCRLLLEKKNTR